MMRSLPALIVAAYAAIGGRILSTIPVRIGASANKTPHAARLRCVALCRRIADLVPDVVSDDSSSRSRHTLEHASRAPMNLPT
jgi:hypothetical protein